MTLDDGPLHRGQRLALLEQGCGNRGAAHIVHQRDQAKLAQRLLVQPHRLPDRHRHRR
jgi:hypothetical protein